MSTQSQELKSLDYINEALDEIGIPRDTGVTRQSFTTWGRVSLLIERYKALTPAGAAPAEARAETAHFIDGEVDYASDGDGQALENIF